MIRGDKMVVQNMAINDATLICWVQDMSTLKWFLGKSMLGKIVYNIHPIPCQCCLSYKTGNGVSASCNNYDLSLINKLELYFTLRKMARCFAIVLIIYKSGFYSFFYLP